VTLENWRLMVLSIQPFFHLLITKKMSFLTKVTRLVAGLSSLYSLTIGELTKCDVGKQVDCLLGIDFEL
jgi:hypothetical protein